jgi:uncharacterized protein YecE (DUF72 family)
MPMLIGTSGWQYQDWRGVLYPPGVPQARWLEHYAQRYPTVENNGTFYRLAAPGTFASWRERTPDGFLMAVKASRYLTHVRRLQDPAEPVGRLLTGAAQLGPRLGPVLLQLPPTLPADLDVLDACLTAFARFRPPPGTPPGLPAVRVAVEFRHDSWWTQETKQLLARHDAALSWADRGEQPLTPLWRTASWAYLRLHEGAGRSWPRYTRATLQRWVSALADRWPQAADAFVYFNNDQHGAAPRDADEFAALARDAGRPVRSPAPRADTGPEPRPEPGP